jgi:hypothetical protein
MTTPPPLPQQNPLLAEIHSHVQSMSPGAQAAIKQAIPTTGISTPPDGGAVRTNDQPIQDPQAHPPVPAMQSAPAQHAPLVNPDPQGSLRPGGTTPPMPILPPSDHQVNGPPPLGSIGGQENETQRLLSTGSGISQIKNPIGRGVAEAGNILGHTLVPGLMKQLPGTEEHHEQLLGQSEGNTAKLLGQQKASTANDLQEAQTGKTQAEIPETEARTGLLQQQSAALPQEQAEKQRMEDAQIQNLLHPQAKTDFEAWRQQNPDKPVSDWIQLQGSPGREQARDLKEQSLAQQAQLAGESRKDREQFHADSEQDRALTRAQMRQNQEDKKNKPTADEQKKADLVDNLNENLGVVEEILHRRPDLFGPIAGRMTEMKNSFGTHDPDIAALEAAQHQLGMVQQGVHGMRSAQGMQGAVDSIMNGFHNSPEAMQRSIETVRSSAKTFSNAVGEKGQPGVGGMPSEGPKVGTVESGYRFKGGDPGKQASWEKVQ